MKRNKSQKSEVRSQKSEARKILASYLLNLASLFILCCFLLPVSSYAMPWSWDMFNQPSHKAQENNPPDMPEGTVSNKGKDMHAKERSNAATIQKPIAPSYESLARGKVMYDTYCAICHGESGRGDGTVGKKYVPPTDLTSEYVQRKPDGDIYYTITYGGLAIMPVYGDAIIPEDRWHLVNYIKHVIGVSERNK
ncbi:MAG: c-type cytochrome [Deltaproteobacteria bacterium]|nr:c-type cytochrome [Deltaproteobacteria bacterium]